MTLLEINLTDVLSETDPDDKVIVWAPVMREGPSGALVGTRRKTIPLADGVGSDEVVPGPLMVQVQCKGISDSRPREVAVPETGPVTLTGLLDGAGAFTYAPPVIGRVAQIRDEAVQAAVDADLAADRAEAGAAVVGDAQTVLDARDQAVTAATNAGTSETAASGSASASASSATAAAASETNAGAAATAAAGFASDAASSATSAATSEGAAFTSATNAAASETAAAGHSSDAQASATAAAGSATSASMDAGRAEAAASSADADATQTGLDRTAVAADRTHVDAQTAAIDTAFTESVPPYLQPDSPGGLAATYAPNPGVTAVVTEPRFGAKGDGSTDDTPSIQAAVDWVAAQGGGEVVVPNGTYMVKAHVEGASGVYLVDEGGIALKDNIHLRMSSGATLHAIPNAERKYIIVRSYNKQNVTISGGTIKGDRDQHDGTAGGEWGYGIAISGGRNIHVEDVRCIDCWGDGINIQEVKRPIPVPEGYVADVAHNVTISRVTCSNNRRQGMSVEGVVGLYVADSVFELTEGTAPNCGVDIEPWFHDQPTQDIVFSRCKFLNNKSSGMLVMQPQTRDVTITDCVFEGNRDNEAQIKTYTAGGGITVEKTTFSGTPAASDAIRMQGGRMLHIRGNTMDARIHIRPDSDSNPADVWVSENEITLPDSGLTARSGILIFRGKNIYVDRNTINLPFSNQSKCIDIEGSSGIKVTANHFFNASNGLRVGATYAPEGNQNIDVTGNTFVDNSAAALVLAGISGLLFSENIVLGACHGNPGEASIYYAGEVSGVRVLNNAFYQAPANATGAGRANRALRWSSFGLDTVASGNRLVPEGTNFPLWLRSSTPLTSGYLGEETGLMTCPTSRRPTLPQVGVQVLDTDLQKVVTYLDSGWVDAQGQPA